MVLAATARFIAYGGGALHNPLWPWAPAWADEGECPQDALQTRLVSPGAAGLFDCACEQVGHELGRDRVDVSPATAAQGPRSRT